MLSHLRADHGNESTEERYVLRGGLGRNDVLRVLRPALEATLQALTSARTCLSRRPACVDLFEPPTQICPGPDLNAVLLDLGPRFVSRSGGKGAGREAERNEKHNENETKNTVEVGP